jgi:hypothetical protein
MRPLYRIAPPLLAALLATAPAGPAVASDSAAAPSPAVAARASTEAERPCRREYWFDASACRHRAGVELHVTLGLDLGVSAMNESGPFGFHNGIGAVTTAGPAWGARVGLEVLTWLALEARYVGMYDSAQASVSPAGGLGYLTSGVEGVVRATAPLPMVRPYVLVGGGYYDNALVGAATARAGSILRSSSQPGVPMGVGFDVPITRQFSVSAEATYHFNVGESFSAVTRNGVDGGDISTFDCGLRVWL